MRVGKVVILRWSFMIALAAAGAALAVAGCAPARAPATDEVGPPGANLPDVTPTLFVPPLYGTAVPWALSQAVALELRRYDVAVATETGNAASYILYSLAEAEPTADGGREVTIYWDLVEPRGELVGNVSQHRTMTAAAWQGVPPDLTAVAADAAARILHILPGARWQPTDPAVMVAAREENRKLEERRRLYRKMAARGGLGPLSRRIFIHAEKQEMIAAGAAKTAAADDRATGSSSGTPPVAPAADRQVAVKTPAAAPAGILAELGAFSDEADARIYWQQLRRAHADLFDGHGVVMTPVELDGRGTNYRVHAGPFGTAAEAAEFCRALTAADIRCFVPFRAAGSATASAGAIRVTDIPEPLTITVPATGGG